MGMGARRTRATPTMGRHYWWTGSDWPKRMDWRGMTREPKIRRLGERYTMDLVNGIPRSPYESMHGIVFLPRAIDKVRAEIAGTLGDYISRTFFSGMLLEFLGIEPQDFVDAVAARDSDEEVWAWVKARMRPRSATEIMAFNRRMMTITPQDDTRARALLAVHGRHRPVPPHRPHPPVRPPGPGRRPRRAPGRPPVTPPARHPRRSEHHAQPSPLPLKGESGSVGRCPGPRAVARLVPKAARPPKSLPLQLGGPARLEFKGPGEHMRGPSEHIWGGWREKVNTFGRKVNTSG